MYKTPLLLLLVLSVFAFKTNAQEKKMKRPKGPTITFNNLEEVKSYLTAEEEKGMFSGNVLAIKDREVVFDQSFGEANKDFGVKNNHDTKINLGSVNKIFTATAIAQLVEVGKLDLDKSISGYIPDFKHTRANDITIRHLLDHKSGFGFYWENEKFLNNRTGLRTIKDYINFIQDEDLTFEPGTQTQYSNSAYEVLGYIVQTVSGEDYYEYIQKHIYDIVGMPNTGCFERDVVISNRAVAYSRMKVDGSKSEGFTQTTEHQLAIKGTAAGGGYSTTEDMSKFISALLGGKLVSMEYLPIANNSFSRKDSEYMLGGGAPGVSAFIGGNVADTYHVVVLCNYDPPTAMMVGKAISELLK